MVHNQLQAKDDCWRIDALYKLQPNKVHSKKMQYMKVHHGEVHHKEVHHEGGATQVAAAQKRSLGKDDCWHMEARYKLDSGSQKVQHYLDIISHVFQSKS